ncbi:MAG: putative quinol monooxygenase [Candidatus Methylacidiphilales bacterium]|nr:putative quinol monooxygenase [Candidatus Methylacidiphilales bacterium]
MSTEIRVVAKIFVRPGTEADFISTFEEAMIVPTRAEPGCILYELHQDTERPDEFIMFERWETKESLDGHFNSPHFKALGEKLHPFLAGAPQIALIRKVA